MASPADPVDSGYLTDQEIAALPDPPTQAERVARRRAIERSAIERSGGGIALAGLHRCEHGRLPVLCEICAP